MPPRWAPIVLPQQQQQHRSSEKDKGAQMLGSMRCLPLKNALFLFSNSLNFIADLTATWERNRTRNALLSLCANANASSIGSELIADGSPRRINLPQRDRTIAHKKELNFKPKLKTPLKCTGAVLFGVVRHMSTALEQRTSMRH